MFFSLCHQLGVKIGQSVDYVILVGEKKTKDIYDGIIESGFNEENIFLCFLLNSRHFFS